MRISYLADHHIAHADVTAPAACFLRSRKTWFSQWTVRQTRYEGWFLADESEIPHRYCKILDRVAMEPWENQVPDAAVITPDSARFSWGHGHLAAVPSGDAGLTLAADAIRPLVLTLDMRGIYEKPDENRKYTLEDASGGVLVTYRDSLRPEAPLFLHIRGPVGAADLAAPRWEEVRYPRDTARNSMPDTCHVYVLPAIRATRLDLGCGFSRDDAIRASARASDTRLPHIEHHEPGDHQEAAVAFARHALQHLRTNDGWYAGFPWFHQFWSRDELITALGLSPEEQRAVITRYASLVPENGELPTFAGSGTTCADGIGWLALLVREHGLGSLDEHLREQLRTLFTAAYQGLNAARKTPSGLIRSGHNATWMDTIGRTGCRIEIQAMFGLLLETLAELSGNRRFLQEKADLHATVRHHLWEAPHLVDGLDDAFQPDRAVRPNAFLTFLLQPDLLEHDEWHAAFRHALAALETPWGGLRSLDRNDPASQPYSTGENNRSYHLGDSWMFVNNLAAAALLRHGHADFQPKALALLNASREELLTQHFLGYPAEIASAADGASWGCGIQAWSAGTYLFATERI